MSACRFSFFFFIFVQFSFCLLDQSAFIEFVLEWRVCFKPWTGEGALGVSESNLAPFYKHDKSTSLCVTNMSVKPANYRCPVSSSFQHSVFFFFFFLSRFPLFCLHILISVWWTEGLYTGNRIFLFYLSLVVRSVWVECMCKYMDECICICTVCIYPCMCFTLKHSIWKPHASIYSVSLRWVGQWKQSIDF